MEDLILLEINCACTSSLKSVLGDDKSGIEKERSRGREIHRLAFRGAGFHSTFTGSAPGGCGTSSKAVRDERRGDEGVGGRDILEGAIRGGRLYEEVCVGLCGLCRARGRMTGRHNTRHYSGFVGGERSERDWCASGGVRHDLGDAREGGVWTGGGARVSANDPVSTIPICSEECGLLLKSPASLNEERLVST
ncbi:hypothetical protein Tco_0267963 [Tanacetum coccineum]